MEELPAALQYGVITLLPRAQEGVCHTAYALQLKLWFCQQDWSHVIHTSGSVCLNLLKLYM